MDFLKDVKDILFLLCPTKRQKLLNLHKKLSNIFPVLQKTIMAGLVSQNEMIEITHDDFLFLSLRMKTEFYRYLQCFYYFRVALKGVSMFQSLFEYC